MKKKVVIAGYDAVSSLGNDFLPAWDRALNGESGIGKLTRFEYNDEFPVKIAGEIQEIDVDPYPFLRPREMAHWTAPIFKYGMLTAFRALKNSSIEITPENAHRIGITFSTAVGGLDAVLNADRKMIASGKLPHPFTNPNSCINMIGGKVSILTGATGPITSTITACATGATSMIIGSMLIENNMADAVICGAVDACLVEPIVAGFATMNGAFKSKPGVPDDDPKKASRPFSIDRKGFIISEGSGAIIICSEEYAKAHGIKYEIEIAGYSMTSDANHFVAPNLATVSRCISESISKAGISSADIDAVNAHGTSTKIGDKIEYDALTSIFGDKIPPVSANKSLIGHSMGASSAIESIFAMHGMKNDILLPTINYTPDPEIAIDCVSEGARKVSQEFLLKNSFGFGGCNSCIVFKKVN